MQDKKHDYQGFHATADIVLETYPKNSEEVLKYVRESIKHSNLNVVNEKIHDFGGAVTAAFILAESHYTLHEYPEDNYLTVDCYTCGKEGDPLAAVNNLIETLDQVVGVKKSKVKFIERGNFEQKKASVNHYSFIKTDQDELDKMQEKLNDITKSLNSDEIEKLQEILDFTAYSDYN